MLKKEKVAEVARLHGELLRKYQVGHPDWYAEMLVCAYVDGQLAKTNEPGFDIKCAEYNFIQVKSRVDGTDGGENQNRTNFRKYTPASFDYAAIVIFEKNYFIKGAVLMPAKDILGKMMAHGHVKWGDIKAHPNAIDITSGLKNISGE